MLNLPNVALAGALILLGVGMYGLVTVRNALKVAIGLQLLVKAVLLILIVAGYASDQVSLAQSFAVTVLAADTVVAVTSLALAIQVKQRMGTLDVKLLSQLRK
ncbi:MAG: hypothetical protein GYB68_00415 [Chloroflexi bacterium]|nr:hypothetical protein [Chloroflexota bacterium]